MGYWAYESDVAGIKALVADRVIEAADRFATSIHDDVHIVCICGGVYNSDVRVEASTVRRVASRRTINDESG